MKREEVLEKYKRPEDRLWMASMLDKIELAKKTGKVQATDFLDIYQKAVLEKELKKQKQDFFYWGGEDAERVVFFFLPENSKTEESKIREEKIAVLRIVVPEEYEHREYLGGILKLGIERKKIGDILVEGKEADIFVVRPILEFLLSNLSSLTRFKNAKITEIKLEEVRRKKVQFEERTIRVASNRLDSIVAELANTSRGKAVELIEADRIILNGIPEKKITKQIKEKDILTIRGKGKYEIDKIEEIVGKGKTKIEVRKYK